MHRQPVVTVGKIDVRDLLDAAQPVVHARAMEVELFGRALHIARVVEERLERSDEGGAVTVVFEQAPQTGVEAVPEPVRRQLGEQPVHAEV